MPVDSEDRMSAIATLKKGEGRMLKAGGLWIYDNEIESVLGAFEDGDIVLVHDFDGFPMGKGFINRHSKIRIRMLTRHEDVEIDHAFWKMRLRNAWEYRKKTVDTASCRVVFGEADFLPGMVIDKFEDVLVVESLALGIDVHKKEILDILCAILLEDGIRIRGIYERSDAKVRELEGMERSKGFLSAPFDTKVEICENGVRYHVDVQDGQKTGFFLDQRENRAAVGRYSKGRNVLNLFCYTGGFSVYALAGGAARVDSVDCSAKAMEMVDRNVALNGFDDGRHTSICADAIDWLKTVPEGKYDLMIVDPPAFAKHRGVLNNALRAYQRLNAAAISKVAPGGLIFTFSCSQVVDKEAFALAVFSAAAQCRRSVRILDRFNQPADHSVNIYHPEGEYLKGLLLYVE